MLPLLQKDKNAKCEGGKGRLGCKECWEALKGKSDGEECLWHCFEWGMASVRLDRKEMEKKSELRGA